MSSIPNYGAKDANNTASVKQFIVGGPPQLWRTINLPSASNVLVITPTQGYNNLFIPGTIFVGNSVVNVSDSKMKTHIEEVPKTEINNLLHLNTKKYKYLNDDKTHYGFIAQEVEEILPELVINSVNLGDDGTYESIKSINYLEMIPLLVSKIKEMQNQINSLEERINKIMS